MSRPAAPFQFFCSLIGTSFTKVVGWLSTKTFNSFVVLLEHTMVNVPYAVVEFFQFFCSLIGTKQKNFAMACQQIFQFFCSLIGT
ncbi:hypothetical protein PFC_00310 [Pyrococcus furiosus COM1]|uniref:Uncharacterized protein n=1 Tax=Pyrococcus furiosus COM1 TaxID=1185654 RepID=I6UZ84_9EURY|nr:hypothetical protein PFC_00310 [Pyrococcus furiosus COM1]